MSFFRNEREGRIRAIWRLIAHSVLVAVTTGLLAMPLSALLRPLLPAGLDEEALIEGAVVPAGLILVWTVATLLAVLLSTWIACRWLDHRRVSDLGLRLNRAWWSELAFGLLLGFGMIAFVFIIGVAAGWTQLTSFGPAEIGPIAFLGHLLMAIVIFGAIGIYEELISRGYHMKNIAESLNIPLWGSTGGVYGAWLITSLIFGLAHGLNPGASVLGIANIVASALLLIGLSYVLTGRLALPIGLHISWNFTQGFVFGDRVSGTVIDLQPLLAARQVGPEVWTGGAFGPEGGLLATAAIIAACAVMLVWIHRREGRIAIRREIAWPPPMRRPRPQPPPPPDPGAGV